MDMVKRDLAQGRPVLYRRRKIWKYERGMETWTCAFNRPDQPKEPDAVKETAWGGMLER
jgi:hypothetical protein